MKKFSKMISIIMMLVLLFITVSNVVFAAPPNPGQYTGDDDYSVDTVTTLGNQIIQIISTIGSIASVIVLIVLGIKYMMGSAEEKAEYKKTMIPYIVGAILIFAATTIANVVFNFATGLKG